MKTLACLVPMLLAAAAACSAPIHAITDISHEFTFYFDGRFAGRYLPEARAEQNWGTLHKQDLSNANLLILPAGVTPCRYSNADIFAVGAFANSGGGVVLLGDYGLFGDEREYRANTLARSLGAEFVDAAAVAPIKAGGVEIKSFGGKRLRMLRGVEWEVLASDSSGAPVLVRRAMGKGTVIIGSKGLCGRHPDVDDSINKEMWHDLMVKAAAGKAVSSSKPFAGQSPEMDQNRDGLRIRSSEYLKETADAIFAVYARCRPALEKILGVPPAPNMLTSLILLPTGGGGFSSGSEIGLGVWWGDFPAKQYGMVELLGHEATHSWVLPFPEPMWNEGLATYAGIMLGRQLGLEDEANAQLASWIDGAKKLDPEMNKIDLTGEKVPHAVAMAKPMWIFEELRKDKPEILSAYFQAKRKLVDPAAFSKYTADDCVAVLSVAAGKDLFSWFRSLGVSVDRSRTSIK